MNPPGAPRDRSRSPRGRSPKSVSRTPDSSSEGYKEAIEEAPPADIALDKRMIRYDYEKPTAIKYDGAGEIALAVDDSQWLVCLVTKTKPDGHVTASFPKGTQKKRDKNDPFKTATRQWTDETGLDAEGLELSTYQVQVEQIPIKGKRGSVKVLYFSSVWQKPITRGEVHVKGGLTTVWIPVTDVLHGTMLSHRRKAKMMQAVTFADEVRKIKGLSLVSGGWDVEGRTVVTDRGSNTGPATPSPSNQNPAPHTCSRKVTLGPATVVGPRDEDTDSSDGLRGPARPMLGTGYVVSPFKWDDKTQRMVKRLYQDAVAEFPDKDGQPAAGLTARQFDDLIDNLEVALGRKKSALSVGVENDPL